MAIRSLSDRFLAVGAVWTVWTGGAMGAVGSWWVGRSARSLGSIALAASLGLLTACANGANRQAWEAALAADPRLRETAQPELTSSPTSSAPSSPIAPTSPTPSPTPIASPSPAPSPTAAAPSPVATGSIATGLTTANPGQGGPLQRYLADWATLGTIAIDQPTAIISRRQFARWLVAANNRLYRDRPAQQIRLATTSPPVFQDLPPSDPDFGAIQGLAEAGLLPSTISGDPTAQRFQPEAPLTREVLVQWKVPLDLRQSLPLTTVEAIATAWGFQDATKIDPRALRAIQADYQNGDLANIRRAFGFTTLFQPKKPVSQAEAAAALWYFGLDGQGISVEMALRSPSPSPTSPETSPGPSSSPSP